MDSQGTSAKKGSFLSDVEEIRRRARLHIEGGAVTGGYKADRVTVLRVLNEALATELVCVLRYKRHYYMASGIHSQAVAEEFLEHASEEQGHADQLAARIVQLDGAPNFSPEGLLTRSHSEYVEGDTLVDMIREDLVAERIAIESYSEIIRYLENNDPTSRRLMEEILAKEEEHAEDMKTLLETVEQEQRQRDK
jgi:bacterioferritin